jgi:hypothetical protein
MLRGAAPCRQGIERCPDVVVLGTLTSPVGGYIAVTTPYTTRFGVPAVGSKVFLQCNSNVDGWQDIPIQFSAIVPTAS